MRDPRLVEIEFLMDADRVDKFIACVGSAEGSFAQVGDMRTTYGLEDPLHHVPLHKTTAPTWGEPRQYITPPAMTEVAPRQ